MDNDIKLSKEQMDKIKKELQSGSVNRENTDDFLKKHLSKEQADSLKKVLSDPDRMKEILSSPLAKSLIEKYNRHKEE